MTLPKQPLGVFLIYSHNDKRVVRKLYERMLKDGIDAWLDVVNLQPGQSWQREIHKAILKSDLVIVCLSHAFNRQNGFRHEELKLALAKANILPVGGIFIIPVRLEKCDMPESLQYLQRVDLFETGGYKKLILALQEYTRKT